MSSLPTEIDFSADSAATPDRMNRAMDYLLARIRALEAIQPEFASVIDELKGVGLARTTDALLPIFEQAEQTGNDLQEIKDQWAGDLLPDQVVADATAAVIEEFADYRHRYLGAKSSAPTLRDDGAPVAIGDMYFDTGLDQMQVLGAGGWKNAGSSVAGILSQITPIVATAAQTVFTIPGGYDVGYLIVTVNGLQLAPADYTATNGTSITMASGLTAGDEVGGMKFGAVTLATVYTKTQIDAGFALIGAAYTKAEADARYALVAASYTKVASDARYANLSFSNLSDTPAARGNLGLGSAAVRNETFFARLGANVANATVSAGTAAPSGGADGDIYLRYTA